MKIGIWGSYNHGNYGDDLMALQFANHLRKIGVEPWVYRIDQQIARIYNINATNSIDSLFKDSKFCIIGGGAMLSEYSVTESQIEKDFQELLLTSDKYQCPVFPISVGGDGKGINTRLSLWRKKFWCGEYCQESTVRLKEDIALVNQFGKSAVYYPDVLWSTSNFWDIEALPKSNGQIHVGINVGKSLRHSYLAFHLNLIALNNKDIVFHLIRTHLPQYPINYELQTQDNSPNIRQHIYTDPISTLRFLKSLDLVISAKLHLGLTALGLGVPFFSYNGTPKTQAFLRSIDAEFAIWRLNDMMKLLRFISRTENILNVRNQFNDSILEKEKELSLGHMNHLENIAKRFGKVCV